ncbi:hypothetical protein P154DRAFT_557028 [Amniculicola lignicola CBS 123094]|uniref:Uncharacterized protein n=1 Tax=Amniculicola lignicola CBS 123094 TaxID=1392246 RepID=A0A6A5VZP0_9PLEO|nr:hypothetical protein P154DRAFT_557028 [Amniculicola lignicola CBS 123094]
MTAVFARSPLQALPMATNRAMTRRRSVKHNFDDDDAPAAKRPRTEANGTSKRTNGATKKAAKTAYDEDDDGFQFTRRASRRTTAKAQTVPEPIPEEPSKPAPARRKKQALAVPEADQTEPQKRRRSARLSGDREQLDAPPEPGNPVPKRTKKSVPVEKRKQHTPAPEPEEKSAFQHVQTPRHDKLVVTKKRDGGATTIMLPFADTPVILRNKEMRKGSKDGHRRSSTGLRGRRASSLIDSGMSDALPHSDVEIRDYYKYIEQSLPEPRRMKQLLTWCAHKALPEKPSNGNEDSSVALAARAIQQELINDFGSKPELSDWFTREETAPTPVIKKPNPKNIDHQEKLEEIEEEIKRLQEEKAAWEAICSASTLMPSPPPPIIPGALPSFADIDSSLLDPSQATILAALQRPTLQPPTSTSTDSTSSSTTTPFTFSDPASLNSYLSKLAIALEPTIDLLADGVHKIEQYRNTAERVADRVLGTAALRLEERDREVKESVGSEGIGVGDVLRGLAGVLNEG